MIKTTATFVAVIVAVYFVRLVFRAVQSAPATVDSPRLPIEFPVYWSRIDGGPGINKFIYGVIVCGLLCGVVPMWLVGKYGFMLLQGLFLIFATFELCRPTPCRVTEAGIQFRSFYEWEQIDRVILKEGNAIVLSVITPTPRRHVEIWLNGLLPGSKEPLLAIVNQQWADHRASNPQG